MYNLIPYFLYIYLTLKKCLSIPVYILKYIVYMIIYAHAYIYVCI